MQEEEEEEEEEKEEEEEELTVQYSVLSQLLVRWWRVAMFQTHRQCGIRSLHI
jgi:hypothetical protein